jgi:hypothetical protein
MTKITSMSKGTTNRVYCRAGMVAYFVEKIEKNLGGRST